MAWAVRARPLEWGENPEGRRPARGLGECMFMFLWSLELEMSVWSVDVGLVMFINVASRQSSQTKTLHQTVVCRVLV